MNEYTIKKQIQAYKHLSYIALFISAVHQIYTTKQFMPHYPTYGEGLEYILAQLLYYLGVASVFAMALLIDITLSKVAIHIQWMKQSANKIDWRLYFIYGFTLFFSFVLNLYHNIQHTTIGTDTTGLFNLFVAIVLSLLVPLTLAFLPAFISILSTDTNHNAVQSNAINVEQINVQINNAVDNAMHNALPDTNAMQYALPEPNADMQIDTAMHVTANAMHNADVMHCPKCNAVVNASSYYRVKQRGYCKQCK